MTDKDYAPLSAHCVRALMDKMYEKRKAAALEIEKLTKDCIQINNHTQVQKLLRVLGNDFAMSQNPNMRKGGLIGKLDIYTQYLLLSNPVKIRLVS